jgi:YVTN family beta-propeller protein
MNWLTRQEVFKTFLASSCLLLLAATHAAAQTPAKALLVIEKDKTQLDIIDPVTLKILASAPVNDGPHEVIASADGKTAYISNYMGQGPQHKLSVVDLVAQKPLPQIDLGALQSPHGLDFQGGELYFTAETSKVIGRYDPATQKIDWVMGTGQDRTHMVWVAPSLDRIVTSNVSSATISIIELVSPPAGGNGPAGGRGPGPGGPPPGGRGPGGNQKSWEITNIPVGRGAEGFDVSPDGKEIWTGNAQDNTVSIINVASKKVVATVPISVNGANRLKFSPDGKIVLVSGLGTGGPGGGPGAGTVAAPTTSNLSVLDAATRKEVKQLNLGGGSAGILMDPDGSRAFVASSGGNKVVVVDLKTLTVTGEIAPLGQPDGMAWAIRK